MFLNSDFIQDESGAVTVDWVVLTAAIIGLGVAVTASVGAGGTDLADDVEASLKGMEIASYIPAATYGEFLWGFGNAVAGSCIAEVIDGVVVESCTPGSSSMNEAFAMSNGEEWTRVTNTIIGEDPVVQWYNADGEEVDAPEPT